MDITKYFKRGNPSLENDNRKRCRRLFYVFRNSKVPIDTHSGEN